MSEKIIREKFTFSEISGIVLGKKDKYAKVFQDLFSLALWLCPAMKIPSGLAQTVFDQNISISILGAKERFSACLADIINASKDKTTDYYVNFNNMIKAHFLLVFSAYYDSIGILLPDREYNVHLDDDTTLRITKDALEEYSRKFADTDSKVKDLENFPDIPDDLSFYTFHEEELHNLYNILTDELTDFYQSILEDYSIPTGTAEKVFATIRELPRFAVENYHAQFLELKKSSPLFAAYAYTGEHRMLSKQLEELTQLLIERAETDSEKHVIEVLSAEKRYYETQIKKRILYGGTDDEYRMLPFVEDIFIPQSYKSLVYDSSGKGKTLLGPDERWEKIEEKDDLMEYIGLTAMSPTLGRKPIIVLGEPGGGKSTLCSILASCVFPLRYHVIVVRLREVNASDPIAEQIEQQIKRDISEKISWSEIRKSLKGADMPLMVVFDGYDELLRVGGSKYTDFIKAVYEFQKTNEDVYGFFVKAIVTSRKNLIDLASIPNKSAVIYLQEFSEGKIDQWIKTWNQHNSAAFSARRVEPFAVRESYAQLAKQPLLLTMLAFYDYDSNALVQETHMNTAALYKNILDKFVSRERELIKNAREDMGKPASENLYAYLFTAAMGMLNRDRLCITQEQFEKDLAFYGERPVTEDEKELSRGVRLFGSFFFINTSKVTEPDAERFTYEFLHNTFGEYLASNYILKAYENALKGYQISGVSADENVYSLYAALSFNCLSEKPNVLELIHEQSDSISEILDVSTDYLTVEIKKLLKGKLIVDISRWMDNAQSPYEEQTWIRHSALYISNLISITAAVNEAIHLSLSDEEWYSLIQYLRAGLKEEELEVYTHLFFAYQTESDYKIKYQSFASYNADDVPHAERIHVINHILCDEIDAAFSGTVYADYLVEPYIEKHHLEVKSELYYLMIIKEMYPSFEVMNTLHKAQAACFEEKKYHILIALYVFLQDKSRLNIKKRIKHLASCVSEGVRLFSKEPRESFEQKEFRMALAELLKMSLIVRVKYEDYQVVLDIMENYPRLFLPEYISFLDYLVTGLQSVPQSEKRQETEHVLSLIRAFSITKYCRRKKSADPLIRAISKILMYHSMNNENDRKLFTYSNTLIQRVMTNCSVIWLLSDDSLHYLLKYLGALFYNESKRYYKLLDLAMRNGTLVKLCEYWLQHLNEYSVTDAYIVLKIVLHIKTMPDSAVDSDVLQRSLQEYLEKQSLNEEIRGAIDKVYSECRLGDLVSE